MDGSGAAGLQMTRLASEEAMTAARATVEIAGCGSPAAMVAAQFKFAVAWFNRAAANSVAIGMQTLRAQDAAMAPIRQAVTSNSERLGRV